MPNPIPDTKTDIINIVAHELQNPLTAIRGYAELVGGFGPLNERQQHYLSRILQTADEMSELVNNMLDMAWVDAGMPLNLTEVHLAHLVNSIALAYQERAAKNQATLEIHIAPVPVLRLDERRIKQVFHNLISNAVKYSPNGGTIHIQLQPQGAGIYFEVKDQGMGIPDEYLPRLAERFFRVPGDHQGEIDGNGLGLAICAEILRRHGSRLEVESQLGQGSRFYFTLESSS
jgi:signal transduction histidine kinase